MVGDVWQLLRISDQAGWDRARCEREIRRAGLPVPPKSACTFCPASRPEEVRRLKKQYLVEIVIMEARARPRLTAIEGLWRNGCKGTRRGEERPGRMTDFIRREGLLPPALIDHLVGNAPIEIVRNQEKYREGCDVPSWHDFLEAFTSEDGVSETSGDFIPLDVLGVEDMADDLFERSVAREPFLRYAA